MNSKFLDYTLLTLVIIGAVNWGLIGFFRFDLVAFLFGNMSWLSSAYTILESQDIFPFWKYVLAFKDCICTCRHWRTVSA